MGFDRSKYQVQKVHADGVLEDLDPDTFFVVRRDDILGTATLWNYVANARLLLAGANLRRPPRPGRAGEWLVNLGPEEKEALETRCEGVAQLAIDWGEERVAKVPD